MFKVGDRVKIKDTSNYRHQAYNNGGNGEGFIVDINSYDDHKYVIEWDNGHENSYREIDIEFIDDNDIVKIKWYKKK